LLSCLGKQIKKTGQNWYKRTVFGYMAPQQTPATSLGLWCIAAFSRLELQVYSIPPIACIPQVRIQVRILKPNNKKWRRPLKRS